jgi:hypothetical protein
MVALCDRRVRQQMQTESQQCHGQEAEDAETEDYWTGGSQLSQFTLEAPHQTPMA